MLTQNFLSTTVEIAQEGGLGLLEVRGRDDLGGALIFKGYIATAIWNDFAGSVGQHLVSAPNHRYREVGVHFREISEIEVNQENLAEVSKKCLEVFSDGNYLVQLQEFDLKLEFWMFENLSRFGVLFSSFYPDAYCMLSTIPDLMIESETVEKWRLKIRSGSRPCVILAQSPHNYGYFIIDGHHKMKAYIREDISPRAIVIQTLNPKELSEDSFDLFDIKSYYSRSKEFAERHTRRS